MAIKLYVGGLPYSMTDSDLEALFAEIGKVVSSAVIVDRDTNRSKGFGFIEMEDDADGQRAIKELDGKDVGGRSIVVNEARPKEDRRPSGGGYR
ncbi:MAG: RNA-binding protein [Candidatus Saccharibacteria bacterium]|jgi:cold-inducible RNA-binding protein